MTYQTPGHGRRIWFAVNTITEDVAHWHESLEIVFVLSGQVDFSIRGQVFTLRAEDLLVINPFDLHMAAAEGAAVLSLHVEPAFLQGLGRPLPRFACCSRAMQEPQKSFQELREWVAHCVSALSSDDGGNVAEAHMHMILSILCRDFAAPEPAAPQAAGFDDAALRYVQRAIQLFQERYAEDWTVQRLAEELHLSAGYLSRIFQANMGVSLMKYLRTLRLRRAMQETLHSSKSVTDIALGNGFPSAAAFIQNFRAEYGQTPGQMRRRHKNAPAAAGPAREPQTAGLERLLKHARLAPEAPMAAVTRYQVEDIQCDCQKRGRTVDCPLILSIGWAREGLFAPVQEQIRQAQREIGFTYLRMHGIFDDSMQIFQGTREQHSFNFNYLDLLYDFVLAQGLTPYVEFSYMPRALAVRPETYYYSHACSICPPSDYGVWNELVSATVLHCVNRYGRAAVRKWKFTAISQCYVNYGCMTEQEWFQLYRETYRAVKNVDKRFSFGGPGNDMEYLGRDIAALLRDFLAYSAYDQCLPDFLSVQCFHVSLKDFEGPEVFRAVAGEKALPVPCTDDPDYLAHCLSRTEMYLQRIGLARVPLVLEAWNSSLWQCDSCHDMRFKAAFIVKNLLENCRSLEGIGYWTLSDITEDTTHQVDVFHGGRGMITVNGIPKSAYHAFRLLARMQGGCIGQGDGWYATRNQDMVAVLLYHYSHYTENYQALDAKGQYAFQSQGPRQFNLTLTGMKEGLYTFSTYRIDARHGSAYDTWLQMGAPQPMNAEQVEYIKCLSIPGYTTCQEYVPREYHYTTTLGDNEIELILCTPSTL